MGQEPKPKGNPNWIRKRLEREAKQQQTDAMRPFDQGAKSMTVQVKSDKFVPSDENEELRKAMYHEVTRRILAGQLFHYDGGPVTGVELHSADMDTVYIFGRNRGNGDKRNCKQMPIWEFCELAGIEVHPEERRPVALQPLEQGNAHV